MIKNIVFDIGDVLIDFRWKAYLEQDLNIDAKAVEVLTEHVIMSSLWDDLNRGSIPDEEIIAQMKDNAPGYKEQIDLFWEKILTIVAVYPYTDAWLKGLKERGYKIYLLSNYPAKMFDLHAEKLFGFLKYTDGRVVSGHVKMLKPEPEIYQELFRTYQLTPSECVFLDDRAENIAGAKALGMSGIVVENHQQAVEDLEKVLVTE